MGHGLKITPFHLLLVAPQANLTFKWSFNNTLETVVELPTHAVRGYSNSVHEEASHRLQPQVQFLRASEDVPRAQSGRDQLREDLSGRVYSYKIDTFANFGTVTCAAENPYGKSGPCYYHILAAGKWKLTNLTGGIKFTVPGPSVRSFFLRTS